MMPNLSFPNLIIDTQPASPRAKSESPRAKSESRIQTTVVSVNVNNRVIYVAKNLERDVYDAVALISRNCFNAERLKKELILNPDILIPLLNLAKLYWHSWFFKTQGKYNASDFIESAFINNKNLSKKERAWVRETIQAYKNNIELNISQHSLKQHDTKIYPLLSL